MLKNDVAPGARGGLRPGGRAGGALLALLAGNVALQVAPAAPLARPAALLQPSFRR